MDVAQRWTFGSLPMSIKAASAGLGFAWYPEERIREELAQGVLKRLPMRDGGERLGDVYLVLVDRDAAGPGTLRLAEIVRDQVKKSCANRPD